MNRKRMQSYIKAHEELDWSCSYDDNTIEFRKAINNDYTEWYQICFKAIDNRIKKLKKIIHSRYVIWYEDLSCYSVGFGLFHSDSKEEIINQLNFWRNESSLDYVFIVYDKDTDTFI